MSKQKIK